MWKGGNLWEDKCWIWMLSLTIALQMWPSVLQISICSSVIHAHCIYYANISGKVIKHTFLSSVYSCRFQPQSVPWPATATAQTDIAYITWLMRLYSACSDESSQTNPIHNHINNHDVVFALRCLSFTADIDIHKASSPVQTLCWRHSVYPKLLIIFDELP